MTHDPGTKYKVYLNQEYDLASVYGFRRTAEDGRKYQTRYLNQESRETYEAEMWILGITELEFEEV